jgi:hypothetical protein
LKNAEKATFGGKSPANSLGISSKVGLCSATGKTILPVLGITHFTSIHTNSELLKLVRIINQSATIDAKTKSCN